MVNHKQVENEIKQQIDFNNNKKRNAKLNDLMMG